MPWASLCLCGALALVFWAERHWQMGGRGGSVNANSLYAMGGLYPPLLRGGHEWHRLFSAVLLHINLVHLAENCAGLLLMGAVLEGQIGRWWFTALFAWGGFTASLFSWATAAPNMVSVGASGADTGLVAAAFVLSFRLQPVGRRLFRAIWLLVFLTLVLGMTMGGAHAHGVDNAAHIGGAFFGAATGYLLHLAWRPGGKTAPLGILAAILAALGLGLYAASGIIAAIHYAALLNP